MRRSKRSVWRGQRRRNWSVWKWKRRRWRRSGRLRSCNFLLIRQSCIVILWRIKVRMRCSLLVNRSHSVIFKPLVDLLIRWLSRTCTNLHLSKLKALWISNWPKYLNLMMMMMIMTLLKVALREEILKKVVRINSWSWILNSPSYFRWSWSRISWRDCNGCALYMNRELTEFSLMIWVLVKLRRLLLLSLGWLRLRTSGVHF